MSEESTLPENVPNPDDGYTIFAESFARWSNKRPIQGLRNLLKDEYPEESQLERDMLALSFLQFEIMRWVLQSSEEGDTDAGKEPWQM